MSGVPKSQNFFKKMLFFTTVEIGILGYIKSIRPPFWKTFFRNYDRFLNFAPTPRGPGGLNQKSPPLESIFILQRTSSPFLALTSGFEASIPILPPLHQNLLSWIVTRTHTRNSINYRRATISRNDWRNCVRRNFMRSLVLHEMLPVARGRSKIPRSAIPWVEGIR